MDLELVAKLDRPVVAAKLIDDIPKSDRSLTSQPELDPIVVEQQQLIDSLRAQLDQRARLLEALAGKLSDAYQQMVTSYKSQVVRLAIEIARKILAMKIEHGQYDIQSILEQALDKVPTRQALTIHVSQKDLATCRQIQQERPESPLASLEFVADPALRPAECVIESPKGLVKYLIDEQLAKVQQALDGAGQE